MSMTQRQGEGWSLVKWIDRALLVLILLFVVLLWVQSTSTLVYVQLTPKETTILMPNYTVSGAGDEAYNGTYVDNGTTENGDPVYEIEAGGVYLYHYDDGAGSSGWALDGSATYSPGAPDIAHNYYNTDPTDPTTDPWSSNYIDPAPTVAEESTAATYPNWGSVLSWTVTDRKHSIAAENEV